MVEDSLKSIAFEILLKSYAIFHRSDDQSNEKRLQFLEKIKLLKENEFIELYKDAKPYEIWKQIKNQNINDSVFRDNYEIFLYYEEVNNIFKTYETEKAFSPLRSSLTRKQLISTTELSILHDEFQRFSQLYIHPESTQAEVDSLEILIFKFLLTPLLNPILQQFNLRIVDTDDSSIVRRHPNYGPFNSCSPPNLIVTREGCYHSHSLPHDDYLQYHRHYSSDSYAFGAIIHEFYPFIALSINLIPRINENEIQKMISLLAIQCKCHEGMTFYGLIGDLTQFYIIELHGQDNWSFHAADWSDENFSYEVFTHIFQKPSLFLNILQNSMKFHQLQFPSKGSIYLGKGIYGVVLKLLSMRRSSNDDEEQDDDDDDGDDHEENHQWKALKIVLNYFGDSSIKISQNGLKKMKKIKEIHPSLPLVTFSTEVQELHCYESKGKASFYVLSFVMNEIGIPMNLHTKNNSNKKQYHKEIIQLILSFHQLSIYHGDLSMNNILIYENQLLFIDLLDRSDFMKSDKYRINSIEEGIMDDIIRLQHVLFPCLIPNIIPTLSNEYPKELEIIKEYCQYPCEEKLNLLIQSWEQRIFY